MVLAWPSSSRSDAKRMSRCVATGNASNPCFFVVFVAADVVLSVACSASAFARFVQTSEFGSFATGPLRPEGPTLSARYRKWQLRDYSSARGFATGPMLTP